ncbi:aa3-type cytochrome c oxidase subunit IV [Candidatus Pelagibacter sp.]|nr:aa3-type cytochrome c oxidase subunit IV [Candidatus Pelagibacter sp.]
MDNKNHKSTWDNFTKFVLWGTVAVILVLVLMTIFLL